MTEVEALQIGRARIAKGHSIGAPARRQDGSICDPDSPDACSWCAIGSLQDLPTPPDQWCAGYKFLQQALSGLPTYMGGGVVYYSDKHTQLELVQLFDKAIDLAKELEVSE